ncbi:MAG TPA: tetratricopeptide repeat protein, partial [Firmicutes bacterium]|nr:tetratricopeptide repeat protein [Bacillota bacterium]
MQESEALDLKEVLGKAEELREGCRFSEALSFFLKALSLCPDDDLPDSLFCHLRAGDCLRMLGRFPEALSHYERAEEISLKLESDWDRADALVGKGLS